MERVLFVVGLAVVMTGGILALGKLASIWFPPRTRWQDPPVRSMARKVGEPKARATFISPGSPRVLCVAGQHVVSRRIALADGQTYDGREVYICLQHHFDRKRKVYLDETRESA